MKKEFWNERYSSEDFVYGTAPNEFFKSQIDKLPPGKLLLPAEGEGRNAVYAAKLNWTIDAFDQSEKGKEKCEALARENNVTINYTVSDALDIPLEQNKYDLIALVFAHFPSSIRNEIHQKCIAALKPGGMLLLEAFTPKQLQNESGGPKDSDMLYSKEILESDFTALKIQSLDEKEIELKESKQHWGKADVIRLVAVK
ncbi:MAG: class I SAM-dependent methyltransferase [Ginsengibacter sp.]